MAPSPDLLAFYRDLYEQAGLGPVTTRAMFGGAGIFKDAVMVSLVAYDQLFLKTDAQTRPRFDAEGLTPFTYDGKPSASKRGRPMVMSYSLCPDAALEDPELFADWAGQAIEAARRAKRR